MRGRGSTAGVWLVWQRRVVPAVLGVVLVAGCTGGGPEPAESTEPPVAEVTPTPTPTPTPVVKPERPAAMDEPTTDGAIAAATYFLQLYDYAFCQRRCELADGDVGRDLRPTASYVEGQVMAMVTEGRSSVGPPAEVLRLRQHRDPGRTSGSASQLRAEQGLDAELDAGRDSRTESDRRNVTDFFFAISWLGDRWRVEGVDLIEVLAREWAGSRSSLDLPRSARRDRIPISGSTTRSRMEHSPQLRRARESVTAHGDASTLVADGREPQARSDDPGGIGPGVVPTTVWAYMNAMACMEASGHWVPAGEDGGCVSGVPQAAALDCAGQEWVEPRWRRYQVPPATDWSRLGASWTTGRVVCGWCRC